MKKIITTFKSWLPDVTGIAVVLFLILFFSCKDDNYVQSDEGLMLKAADRTTAIIWGPRFFRYSIKQKSIFEGVGYNPVLYEGPFTLKLDNGNVMGHKVLNAEIKVDGKVIFGPADFASAPDQLSKEIMLKSDGSVIGVVVSTAQNAFFKLWIEGKKNGYIPSVTTSEPANVSGLSATLGGNVTSEGYSPVTERGICYNTTGIPAISDNKVPMGSGTGTFSNTVTVPAPGTTYYVRAYATNNFGTSYGNEVSFTTSSGIITGTFYDSRDGGRVYKWVKIGNQYWMAENLAYLPSIHYPGDLSNEQPRYYVNNYYVNPPVKSDAILTEKFIKYGALYNWQAAKIVCPDGWHLPGHSEWDILAQYIVSDKNLNTSKDNYYCGVATFLKSANDWNGTDYYKFNALPGGHINSNGESCCPDAYKGGYWWTSTEYSPEPYSWNWPFDDYACIYFNYGDRSYGMSVRCVRSDHP